MLEILVLFDVFGDFDDYKAVWLKTEGPNKHAIIFLTYHLICFDCFFVSLGTTKKPDETKTKSRDLCQKKCLDLPFTTEQPYSHQSHSRHQRQVFLSCIPCSVIRYCIPTY